MKRGRKSAQDLQVVAGNFRSRPEPPEALSDDEAEIWRSTCSSEAVDFFSTSALRDMLADYCRHRASANKLSEIIQQFQPEWLKSTDGAKRYGGLIRMRDLETRAAADKATKLRLTNQARYTPQAAATASRNAGKGARPWEF